MVKKYTHMNGCGNLYIHRPAHEDSVIYRHGGAVIVLVCCVLVSLCTERRHSVKNSCLSTPFMGLPDLGTVTDRKNIAAAL